LAAAALVLAGLTMFAPAAARLFSIAPWIVRSADDEGDPVRIGIQSIGSTTPSVRRMNRPDRPSRK